MATTTPANPNPFLDPALSGMPDQGRLSTDTTLVVNKDTSMTLGADALVVFGSLPLIISEITYLVLTGM